MKFTKNIISIVSLFIALSHGAAQGTIGSWTSHLSYAKAEKVENAGDLTYVVSNGALFSYRASDNSTTSYSKINGFNDNTYEIVRYYPEMDLVFLGYDNGNIDLIVDGDIINIPDVKIKTLSGNKSVNNVTFHGDYAYLSLDIGIVVINLLKYEVKETYVLNFSGSDNAVNDIEIMDDNIYAATDLGLYVADINTNLLDTRNWNEYTQAPESTSAYQGVKNFNGKLIGVRNENGTKFKAYWINNGASYSHFSTVNYFKRLQAVDDQLILTAYTAVVVYNENLDHVKNITSYSLDGESKNVRIFDCDFTGSVYQLADENNGLVTIDLNGNAVSNTPNGPYSNTIFDIDYSPAGIRIVHGAMDGAWNNKWTTGAVSEYDGARWTSKSSTSYDPLSGISDIVQVETDPDDPTHYFMASWGLGVVEMKDGEFVNLFDDTNSSLHNIFSSGSPYVRVHGLTFDEDGNLWLSNSQVDKGVSVRLADGTWKALSYTEVNGKVSLGQIIVTSSGQKWMQMPRNQGIFVFDEMGTFDTQTDDEHRFFEVYDDEGEVVSNDVHDLVEDKDGAIWVATANGVPIYYNTENVFTSTKFPCYRVKIPRNDGTGRADYLLDGEQVNAIAVDGGNRKWLGTASTGLLLVSADGLQTIHHFTTSNSPLPSNSILDLEINDETGEVYISTDKGLVSYRSDATAGGDNFSELAAFPNPVRENYTGDLIIKGLMDESLVKITDVSGNLVYETESNGGTASWNMQNFFGRKVATGVYLIFVSSTDGEESGMTKVLIVN